MAIVHFFIFLFKPPISTFYDLTKAFVRLLPLHRGSHAKNFKSNNLDDDYRIQAKKAFSKMKKLFSLFFYDYKISSFESVGIVSLGAGCLFSGS